jgi:hypothetical protein
MHASALPDHAVDRGHADASLQRHDLDGERMGHAMSDLIDGFLMDFLMKNAAFHPYTDSTT